MTISPPFQVSRLVILHEEAEDGNAMPDLSRPVQAVSMAVANLIKVGHETINNSDDDILKREMPQSLTRVELASSLLEDAARILKVDSYSNDARRKLIEGSRGILQGTSSLLLCFDESEVRKIIRNCKRVLDYLAISEVIDTMEDLIQFLKDLSPCLSRMTREISDREKELTHQVHSEILTRCLEQVKILAPILICAMKVYIHIQENNQDPSNQTSGGSDEAAENRNYLSNRMSDEIHEIIRVLQLTTYEEDGCELDRSIQLKKLLNTVRNKTETANSWLDNPYATRGGIGEKGLRSIFESARKFADLCPPVTAARIRSLVDEMERKADRLADLRAQGLGKSPEALALAEALKADLRKLGQEMERGVIENDRDGAQQIAHSIQGRLGQIFDILDANGGEGAISPSKLNTLEDAVNMILKDALNLAQTLPDPRRSEIQGLCSEIRGIVGDLKRHPADREMKNRLKDKLLELQKLINDGVLEGAIDDFLDIQTPLKQFMDAVHLPKEFPNRSAIFQDKANNLKNFSDRVSRTCRNVAANGSGKGFNKKAFESANQLADHLDNLTPQLINAGRIKANHVSTGGGASAAIDEHLNNLKNQYQTTLQKMRNLCDQILPPDQLIPKILEKIRKNAILCDTALERGDVQAFVNYVSNIARLVNRILTLLNQECENSEDPQLLKTLSGFIEDIQNKLANFVASGKEVAATNLKDHNAINRWRGDYKGLMDCLQRVEQQLCGPATPPPPPRPPLPVHLGPERPPPPVPSLPLETDDEDDSIFMRQMPNLSSQPIFEAAQGLHKFVREWSSKDNEIIAAAKRMAILMARLSELVEEDSKNSKRELIATAKQIAEASEDVTRAAKTLARECTDKRIRTNLLQVCERIPTIGTQLKILSTVKATMLGAQGSDEDREATEMLVGNAQNLMQSVKETVKAAEGASVKIRSDQTSQRMRWVRKQPWYRY